MSQNTIFYGPPGTGKTYLLQSLMNEYIDYDISDADIKNAYMRESREWIIITLVILQNQGKMQTKDIQLKVDNLKLGIAINVGSILDKHNIKSPPIQGAVRSLPRIFSEIGSNEWYVDLVRVQSARKDFFCKFLSSANIIKRYDFVTFHQSYSYENFIEGIRPEFIHSTKSIDYSPKDGVFKSLCIRALAHKEKPYAIFIDEINRGNISEIFGELISLIEIDKREGENSSLSAILPYSKENFSVPSNINIYGTMNTADRSINQIDIALRRRFTFVPLLPNAQIIKTELELQGIDANNINGIDLIKMFNTINARIEILLDSQHMLGHAMFIKCKTLEDIVDVLKKSVIPLLEEYFYDDVEKIQLILDDLDNNGDLDKDAIYTHTELRINDYFKYSGDYILEDKKHYKVSNNINKKSIEKIYL